MINKGSYIIIGVTIIVIIIAIYIKFESNNTELITVASSKDNRKYIVRNLPDSHLAADSLSMLRNKLIKIVEYMGNKYSEDDRVKRLVKNFNPDAISESLPDSKYTSYSVNKGEKILFCIRQRDEQNNLVDLNTMTFVGIHELSHLMTVSIGHEKEFWDNMEFLLKCILDSGQNIYQYQPFHKDPKPYCGTTITDTPVKLN
jgi:hypothetical protein